jgi:hypothetical protein
LSQRKGRGFLLRLGFLGKSVDFGVRLDQKLRVGVRSIVLVDQSAVTLGHALGADLQAVWL